MSRPAMCNKSEHCIVCGVDGTMGIDNGIGQCGAVRVTDGAQKKTRDAGGLTLWEDGDGHVHCVQGIRGR